jgi:hypothetical protein
MLLTDLALKVEVAKRGELDGDRGQIKSTDSLRLAMTLDSDRAFHCVLNTCELHEEAGAGGTDRPSPVLAHYQQHHAWWPFRS